MIYLPSAAKVMWPGCGDSEYY